METIAQFIEQAITGTDSKESEGIEGREEKEHELHIDDFIDCGWSIGVLLRELLLMGMSKRMLVFIPTIDRLRDYFVT